MRQPEYTNRYCNISELKGKIISKIDGLSVGEDQVTFTLLDGEIYHLLHEQECCETVEIEDVSGDVNDLLYSEILLAEESTNSDPHPHSQGAILDYEPESYTWTFYRLITIKGSVVIRWLGISNGYYSESVSFVREFVDDDKYHIFSPFV